MSEHAPWWTATLSEASCRMVVAFLPFAISERAGAIRSGHDQATAAVFYGVGFDVTALTFNAVWLYARGRRLLSNTLDPAGATANQQTVPARLGGSRPARCSASCGATAAGSAVIAAFNAFYWLPIRGESPRRR